MMEFNDEIESIEFIGEMECLDIEVSDDHLFYANNILTKNSIGTMASADMALIFGANESQAIYESELFYKIVKNRLGGRVGEINKFYYDQRSLKMYDALELDMWQRDALLSGDTRKASTIVDAAGASRGNRSGGTTRNRR
jgi:hypothetical protein